MDIESDDLTEDHFDSDHLASSLPEEIIIEILIKLPVKSLLQFMCVCRSWCALISNPIFVKKHLRAVTEDENYEHHRLITKSFCADVEWSSLLSVLREESPIGTHALDYPMKHPCDWVGLIGSLNGLVCISIDQSFIFLWNPSTRISKRLLHSNTTHHRRQDVRYGFGYDEGSSEYKVVYIYTVFNYLEFSFDTNVKIYGLKSDSWKTVENYPKCYTMSTMGVFVSGSLHWDSDIKSGINNYHSIISLNLSKETFSVISSPCSRQEGNLNLKIGVLGGCLALFSNFVGKKIDVWVMKEHGKIESWSKLFSLPTLYVPIFCFCSTPLCISKRNEVFLVNGPHLVVYNLETKTVRHSLIDKFYYVLEAVTYCESLVTPFPE
ncbi:F-box/kelch-repeat protein At3g23880-like [Impatiens glandulifera]|uniref:F-box/kelch-repeat protein At3g23880-like n=1 Tax=Impatiens glandulifera TaxID=253017 RepID=UPI001FB097FB|nr:F-box/kelch-repeat protein At3g23880-like [Impatiens glandulifera]